MATDLHIQHLVFTPKNDLTFTGKEWCKSQWLAQRGLVRGFSETGYSYFGARYIDHELMTMWLSVDPMADKYPSISPYAYCSWKPIILVDPDGQKDSPFRLGDKHVLKIPGTETRIYTNKIGLMQVYSPYSILNAYNCHSFAWHGSWGDKNPADDNTGKIEKQSRAYFRMPSEN